jgi:pyruvate-formate lyase-activating enzyme
MTLTVKELKEKIEQVEKDISSMDNIKSIDALNFYKEYLLEQLEEARQNERKNF